MTSTLQPGGMLYTQGFGSRPENLEVPHIDVRAPAVTDVNYPVGKQWTFVNNAVYDLLSLSSLGGVLQANWNQSLNLNSSGNAVIPGSLTLTNGNLNLSGAGTGFVTNPTVVGPGASPQTANGRVGSVTFSGVSIAAGATQTFTITNSAITGATTLLLLSFSGATAGSALTLSSVVNSAGSSAITVTNGTGATTDVANITFTYEVLN